MNPIAEFVKEKRKEAGLTQREFAVRSGLGLRFVRELEQGKGTVRRVIYIWQLPQVFYIGIKSFFPGDAWEHSPGKYCGRVFRIYFAGEVRYHARFVYPEK